MLNGNAANYTDVVNSRYDVRVPLLRVKRRKAIVEGHNHGPDRRQLPLQKEAAIIIKKLTANVDFFMQERLFIKDIITRILIPRLH